MSFHVHVSPWHRYWDSWHDYCMFVNYWYTDTLLPGIPLYGYSVHVLHYCYLYSPVYMHWLSMYSCYMDHDLYYCYMAIPGFPLIEHCFCYMDYCYTSSPSCIPVTWLFPITDIDIPVTGYMSCWYTMCGIPHLLFPFLVILFYAINRAQVMLSCYMYHALYLFCYVVYFKWHIIKITWGWGDLTVD